MFSPLRDHILHPMETRGKSTALGVLIFMVLWHKRYVSTTTFLS